MALCPELLQKNRTPEPQGTRYTERKRGRRSEGEVTERDMNREREEASGKRYHRGEEMRATDKRERETKGF